MFKSSLVGLLFLVSMQSHAATYSFECITNNSGSCSTAPSLLSLTTTDLGDDSAPLDPENTAFSYGGDVSFQIITSGGNLPAGNNIGFTSTYSTDAVPPSGDDKNGIDNGEWFGITFFDTDYDSILASITSGGFDSGLHFGSLEGGYSEAASLGSVSAVTLPATIWLFGAGLLTFVGMGRRVTV